MYANVNKSKILYSTTFYDKEVYKCVRLFLQSYSIVLYSAVLCIAAIKYQVCPHAIMYNSIEPTPTDLAGAVVLCPGVFDIFCLYNQ